MHLPGGYRYCGPGTRLEARLKRGDRGINELDESCKKHDMAYAENKDLASRHQADDILAKDALKVVKSKKARIGERLSALGVAGVMKAKVKLGMGLKSQNLNKCLRLMQKVKQSIQHVQNDIDKSITALQENTTNTVRKTPPPPVQTKRNAPAKVSKSKAVPAKVTKSKASSSQRKKTTLPLQKSKQQQQQQQRK